MSEELIKHRGRLSSQAVTAAEELPQSELSSITFKPKEDPDAPPQLELESAQQLKQNQNQQLLIQDLPDLQLKIPKRSRTKSQDCSYTFLGFMQKKLRYRIMSQQFNQKLKLFNSTQQ